MGTQQWLRDWMLTVGQGTGSGSIPNSAPSSGAALVLSQSATGKDLRIAFNIQAPDAQTPNHAVIRCFNLSASTEKQVKAEFNFVNLQAGYQGSPIGMIFQGAIKQFRTGRIDAKDSYLDILAACGDEYYNFGIVSATLAPGVSPAAQRKSFAGATFGVSLSSKSQAPSGAFLPRGKVQYGMAAHEARNLASSYDYTWSIGPDGNMIWTPLNGYVPGEAVVLTTATGLIGVPEQTDNGIRVRCLLNPKIVPGGLVKIDNASIAQTQIVQQSFPGRTGINFVAPTSADGTYKVIVLEYEGDTRGRPWYCDMICLSAPGGVLQPFSGQ
jgi:hypothetical protein